jgi:hypothetical protein
VQDDPAELAHHRMMKDDLNSVLLTLTERECGILKMRYGLDDGHEKTLEEVGKAFNVSVGREKGWGAGRHAGQHGIPAWLCREAGAVAAGETRRRDETQIVAPCPGQQSSRTPPTAKPGLQFEACRRVARPGVLRSQPTPASAPCLPPPLAAAVAELLRATLLTCPAAAAAPSLPQVTRERIRQIEAKAIRKLRSPSRLGQLVHL